MGCILSILSILLAPFLLAALAARRTPSIRRRMALLAAVHLVLLLVAAMYPYAGPYDHSPAILVLFFLTFVFGTVYLGVLVRAARVLRDRRRGLGRCRASR